MDLFKEINEKLESLLESGEYKTWLDVPDLQKYLNLSESKIRHLVSENAIPFRRIGPRGKILFNRKMIDLFVLYNGEKISFTKSDRKILEILN